MASVSIKKVVKRFGNNEVLHGVDLDVIDHEFLVLVGPSGCGKSTLLRMIAGLEEITSGEIFIGDVLVNYLPPRDREIAMVFQDYALYPHMTVEENMSFGLRLRIFLKMKSPSGLKKLHQFCRLRICCNGDRGNSLADNDNEWQLAAVSSANLKCFCLMSH